MKCKMWKDRAEWVDDEVMRAIDKKKRLYVQAIRSGIDMAWQKYKVVRTEVASLLRYKKRQYIVSTLKSKKGDPKGFWKEIGKNLHIGKQKPSAGCTAVKCENSQVVTDKAAANAMNNYYVNVGPNLAEKFKESWIPNDFFTYLNVVPFSFKFVTVDIVNKVVKSLPINKSSGVNNLSTRSLRDGFLCMIVEFTHLINECLRLSIMPKKWKIGTITPLPKGKISTNPGDWRPVSVLPFPSKVIERVVNHQLVYHFECNSYLYPNQHGFRRGLSTSTAIFDYVQFLYDSYDSIKSSSSVFIDYSRAFDTIDHTILCKKLKLYGLDLQALNWFCNYLSDRKQMVKINCHLSDMKPVQMGVPQGSIIGPFLFIIYVNDLVSELRYNNVNMLLYADDTILYTSSNNVTNAVNECQSALNNVCRWCSINRLSMNIKKTKHMLVMSNRETCHSDDRRCKVFVNNVGLENVHSYNYLGVTVDDSLTFTDFVDQKYNKVNMRLYQLKRLRPYVTNDIANGIYKQTILPLIDYADFMIESTSQTVHNKLVALQERSVLCIDNGTNSGMSLDELHTLYNVQPLKLRWREHILCLMYRQSKKRKLIDVARPRMNLRSHDKVKFKKVRMRMYELYLRSPMCRCIRLWDMLKAEVQRATTKVKFKLLIKPMCRPT